MRLPEERMREFDLRAAKLRRVFLLELRDFRRLGRRVEVAEQEVGIAAGPDVLRQALELTPRGSTELKRAHAVRCAT